jgi:hypothetical protein
MDLGSLRAVHWPMVAGSISMPLEDGGLRVRHLGAPREASTGERNVREDVQ